MTIGLPIQKNENAHVDLADARAIGDQVASFERLDRQTRPPLTDDELHDQLAEFNELLTDAMARSGIFYTIRHDLDAWAALMASAPGMSILNPTFDPSRSDQSKSFWLQLHDRHGETMAMIANRLIETDDYVGMMMDGTAWFDRPRPAAWPVMTLRLNPVPVISGKIHSRGGLYAYPQFRKRGLAHAATRLMRSLSLSQGVDWTVSQSLEGVTSRNLPTQVYGYTQCNLAFSGEYFPPHGRVADVYLVTVTAAEMASQLAGDIDWLRMRDQQDLGEIALAWRASQRNEQAVESSGLATVA